MKICYFWQKIVNIVFIFVSKKKKLKINFHINLNLNTETTINKSNIIIQFYIDSRNFVLNFPINMALHDLHTQGTFYRWAKSMYFQIYLHYYSLWVVKSKMMIFVPKKKFVARKIVNLHQNFYIVLWLILRFFMCNWIVRCKMLVLVEKGILFDNSIVFLVLLHLFMMFCLEKFRYLFLINFSSRFGVRFSTPASGKETPDTYASTNWLEKVDQKKETGELFSDFFFRKY